MLILNAIFRKVIKIISNPHFWGIAIILSMLLFLHYSYLFGIGSMPMFIRKVSLFAYSNDLFRATFLIPVLYAGYFFRISGAIVVALIVTIMLMARPFVETYHFGIERNAVFAFAALIAGLFIAIAENRRQREKEAFEELEKNRQAYLSQLLVIQEKERQRIALEIHDDAVQMSLGIANMAQSLIDGEPVCLTSEGKEKIAQIRDLSLGMCGRLKNLSRELRPSTLDHLGLIPAIQHNVNKFNRENSIKIDLNVKGTEHRLPSEDEVNIYRIIQEALTNIKRHSGATSVQIDMDFEPDRFKVVIKDNGKGIKLPDQVEALASYGKLGLLGMYERARLIGASLSISSNPGQWTRIILERTSFRTEEPKLSFDANVIKTEDADYPKDQEPSQIG